MNAGESTGPGTDLSHEDLRSVLRAHPVRVAVLFGSQATGETHSRSDIDIAVELDGLRPGDRGYNEAFFGLSADLSEILETDAVDVVDIHTLTPVLSRHVFETGIVLIGSTKRVSAIRRDIERSTDEAQPPRQRFDEAIERIDSYLG